MNLAKRLERLEAGWGGQPCFECGATPGGPMEFNFAGREEPYEGPSECPGCGRVLHFTFNIGKANARDMEE